MSGFFFLFFFDNKQTRERKGDYLGKTVQVVSNSTTSSWSPHLLACRSAQPLLENTEEKLSQFCHVLAENILNVHDFPKYMNQNAHSAIIRQLNLVDVAAHPNLLELTNRAETYDNLSNSVRIAMVGKYVGLTDSYLSVVKALLHACIACSMKPAIDWIAASDLEDESAKSATPEAHATAWKTLKISVIEFARSVLGWEDANSEEFDEKASNLVIKFMPEILELSGHPYYVGVQFHPEFKSRPGRASAPFLGLILATTKQLKGYLKTDQNGS